MIEAMFFVDKRAAMVDILEWNVLENLRYDSPMVGESTIDSKEKMEKSV